MIKRNVRKIKHQLVHTPRPQICQCNKRNNIINIPILPEAFLTFASKSSVGPSYVANGQEDHKTYTNQPSADFSGTERKKEKEEIEEKEHGETIKGPPQGGA